MILEATVRKNQYQDSVRLMNVSRQAGALPGVSKVLALLGTESNKKVLDGLGLLDAAVAGATANDLVICVEAETRNAVAAAVAELDRLLQQTAAGDGAPREDKPRSLEEAAERLPGANLALISLPGRLARLDATVALRRGLNVMLFSDNMTVAEEIELKRLAVSRGLLCLGPDCGTAIVNGVPLAFANSVPRGGVGVAAASGTGTQEVTCLIARFGGGISHALGVGGRDLRQDVGGLMMSQAIAALRRDPVTQTLVLISKPGAPEVMRRVMGEAAATGLPVVACLLGADDSAAAAYPGVKVVSTLEEAAFAALGRPADRPPLAPQLVSAARTLDPRRRFLRGLYSGGTLCYETLFVLRDRLDIHSNEALRGDLQLAYPARGTAHCCVDMGADEFTDGVPHPMIDLGARLERLAVEMRDPEVKVILLDLVLGYGSHPDPAPELVRVLAEAGTGLADGGPLVLAHVCGTEADPQCLSRQERILAEAGVFLFDTNAQAARAAEALVSGSFETGGDA